MTRVVCVINELDVGGAERLLVDQIRYSEGIDFHVCLLSAERSVLAAQLAKGVSVHDLGSKNRSDPHPVARLRRVLLENRPAIIHAHLPRAGAVAALARRGSGEWPMVYTEHSVWAAYRPISRVLAVVSAHSASVVVAVSERVRQSCLRNARVPSKRIRVIRSGLALDRLGPVALDRPGRLRERTGPFRLCSIGNLFRVKGHEHLLRALASVGPDAMSLDIFGDGPELPRLQALTRQLGLEGAVRFRGQDPNAAAHLPEYDGFCLSSLAEGLPIALIEAMGTGLPVIATAVGGVPDVVRHRSNGLLVPPGDAPALALASRELVESPELSEVMGRNASHTVRTDWNIARSAAEYSRLYEELL